MGPLTTDDISRLGSGRGATSRRRPRINEAGQTKVPAWIEPTANGGFEATITQVPHQAGPSIVKGRVTFGEARDWVEEQSIMLRQAIRWMSSP
jgi:hypothetical protein